MKLQFGKSKLWVTVLTLAMVSLASVNCHADDDDDSGGGGGGGGFSDGGGFSGGGVGVSDNGVVSDDQLPEITVIAPPVTDTQDTLPDIVVTSTSTAPAANSGEPPAVTAAKGRLQSLGIRLVVGRIPFVAPIATGLRSAISAAIAAGKNIDNAFNAAVAALKSTLTSAFFSLADGFVDGLAGAEVSTIAGGAVSTTGVLGAGAVLTAYGTYTAAEAIDSYTSAAAENVMEGIVDRNRE
jgi:hypothetical protein